MEDKQDLTCGVETNEEERVNANNWCMMFGKYGFGASPASNLLWPQWLSCDHTKVEALEALAVMRNRVGGIWLDGQHFAVIEKNSSVMWWVEEA